MLAIRIILALVISCLLSIYFAVRFTNYFQLDYSLFSSKLTNSHIFSTFRETEKVGLGIACHYRKPSRNDDWPYFLERVAVHHKVYKTVNATNHVANLVGWTNAYGLYRQYLPSVLKARSGLSNKIVGVELGTWAGKATAEMATVMKYLCNGSCLLLTPNQCSFLFPAIDTWLGDPSMITSDENHPLAIEMRETGRLRVFDLFLKNMIVSNVSDLVVPLRLPADMAASLLKCMRLSVDLIWMDTYQEYDQVRTVIESWWPLLNSGGMFFGSDYVLPSFPGVVQAANDFVRENHLTFLNNSLNKQTWIVRKP